MKRLHYISVFILLAVLITSCKKYSDFQTNPNLPSNTSPALLLTNICYSLFYTDNTGADFASRYLTYYERGASDQDYSWSQGSFSDYDILRQVKQMDSLANEQNQLQYLGLTKLFRAILFSRLTERFGDIPYSQALEGVEGNFKPAYDKQESIYIGLLQELEEANDLLDASKGKLSGDIIYDGDANQWKKFANAFKLRLLIHLSKKENDAALNIKQQFQNIVSNSSKYPLFTSNADNAQLVFNASATNNYYPDYGYLSFGTSISMEKGFIDILRDRKDPRLFEFAEPRNGLPAGDFDNYDGVNGGLTISEQQTVSANASKVKVRYHDDKINEPWIFMGYAEQEFLIAEAISRNWITGAGTAKEHYDNGVIASMAFYGISESDANDYLQQPNVAFNAANALYLIAIQKYIAMFMNSYWEPFMEHRRTGIPEFHVGPGTYNDMRVPKRWQYPQSEYDYNLGNVTEAVQSQYGGDDDINEEMWLIK
jgi:hypothetical protein